MGRRGSSTVVGLSGRRSGSALPRIRGWGPDKAVSQCWRHHSFWRLGQGMALKSEVAVVVVVVVAGCPGKPFLRNLRGSVHGYGGNLGW